METTVQKNKDSGKHNQINYAAVNDVALIIRAINHKLRQQILKVLEENKRMKVTDIYVKLRLDQSVTSQHLAILRNANIVTTEREGKQIFYSLNYARIEEVIASVNKIVRE